MAEKDDEKVTPRWGPRHLRRQAQTIPQVRQVRMPTTTRCARGQEETEERSAVKRGFSDGWFRTLFRKKQGLAIHHRKALIVSGRGDWI